MLMHPLTVIRSLPSIIAMILCDSVSKKSYHVRKGNITFGHCFSNYYV